MRLYTLLLLGLLAITSGYAYTTFTSDPTTSELLKKISEVSTPTPLRGSLDSPAGTLTINGILTATNQHRAEDGQSPLTGNDQLNQVAAKKLNDMLANQYFAHVAPDGTGPSDLADSIGYQYIHIGENLALGNYASDAELVQAWMDSPGHRANILSKGFTEIGIAAAPGTFEGNDTWLAVQSFGLPTSTCPEPDPHLEGKYQTATDTLDAQQAQLDFTTNDLTQRTADLTAQIDENNSLDQQGADKIKAGNELITAGNQLAQDGQTEKAQTKWDAGKNLQQAGQNLQSQAAAQRESLSTQRAELENLRSAHNDAIDNYNKQANNVRHTVDKLNAAIRQYNQCAERFSL